MCKFVILRGKKRITSCHRLNSQPFKEILNSLSNEGLFWLVLKTKDSFSIMQFCIPHQKILQLKTYFSGGVTSRPTLNESSVAQEHIKERERELERIHRRSRELMLSPRHEQINFRTFIDAQFLL